MPQPYGATVILCSKSHDTGLVTRVNALVLRSVVQPDGAETFNPKEAELKRVLKGAGGKALKGGEYLDLLTLQPLPEGQDYTTVRVVEAICRLASIVPPYVEGSWIGWELPAVPVKDSPKLKAFLMANFKDETGNETPEDCAIRLLAKSKAKK